MRARLRIIIAGAGLATAGSASAQGCNACTFPPASGSIIAARVVTRVPILDGVACPDPAARCSGKAYLVGGDIVARSAIAQAGYAWVAFFERDRQTTGWVASDNLVAARPPVEDDWSGRWKRLTGDATISVRKAAGGRYQAKGFATNTVTRIVRTGAVAGSMSFRAGRGGVTIATFGSSDGDGSPICRVEVWRFGRWLLANDGVTDDANSPCGGMGVTLTGIYRSDASHRSR